MGAPGSGEFPWQPAASSRPQAQEGLGLCPGVLQNTRGPVAFLPTDQASSPRDSRAPVLGHRRVGAGGGSPEYFAPPASLGLARPARSATLCTADPARGSPRIPPRPTWAGWGAGGDPGPRRPGTRAGPQPGPRGRRAAGYANARGAGGGRLPLRIKARGGAPRRSRCLPGAGRALRLRARPQHARAAAGSR